MITALIGGMFIGALVCVAGVLCHFAIQHHRAIGRIAANQDLQGNTLSAHEKARFEHDRDIDSLAQRQGIKRYGKGDKT